MPAKKAKQKQWFTLVAPEIFGSRDIGKTPVSDPAQLLKRRVKVSAIDLTENFSKYYMKISLKVNKIDGDKAQTVFDGSEVMRDYISRMVLRHVNRIDTVQDLQTKDGIKIRVKCITVIGRRVKSSIVKQVSEKVKEMVRSAVSESTLEELLQKILDDEIKNTILNEASVIYPVRNFEFRKTEILK